MQANSDLLAIFNSVCTQPQINLPSLVRTEDDANPSLIISTA
jgi:hypothetical protein